MGGRPRPGDYPQGFSKEQPFFELGAALPPILRLQSSIFRPKAPQKKAVPNGTATWKLKGPSLVLGIDFGLHVFGD